MHIKNTTIKLPEGNFTVPLQFFDSSDQKKLKEIYEQWVDLSNKLQTWGGRRINIPELLSEAVYCINYGAGRMNGGIAGANTSFDCYDVKTSKRIQVKACSVEEDLTSFGPKSVWDEIHFIHFYPNKKYDGTYNIYKIPNNLIYDHKVNKDQTMSEQQQDKRRPRFSIMKEIIKVQKLRPQLEGRL
jgi:hypothetical protein